MATLGSSMQIFELRKKHNIIITTKITNNGLFYKLCDEIVIRRISPYVTSDKSYTLNVTYSYSDNMFVSTDYSSLNGGGISTLTISNPYDSTVGSIDKFTGTTKIKISFSEDKVFTTGECILIKYNPSLTKIELE